jgi:hypothetical protein
MFEDGRAEGRSGRSSVVSDDRSQSVDQKFVKDSGLQFQNFRVNFHKFSHTLLYEIITVRLGCHKFYARLVPKMLTGAHKTQRMASTLTFLER